nr:hypothetical protein [Erwinia amylovora]
MAIELLTAVFHPAAPSLKVSPELYFATLEVPQRLDIVVEQLESLVKWEKKFISTNIVASVNIDGSTLLATRQNSTLRRLIARCAG